MIKRGLSLEEAFKALNGRLDLTSGSKDIKRKKTMTESVSDFPKLAELTRGNVFTAYFGNHESCDFSYNPTTAILTQTYYDPEDVFTYRNIKTQTDFENVVRNNLGDVIITWERKKTMTESVAKKVDLDYYDLEEVVENIKDDLDFNLNIDDIIDYEMDEDGIVTIYLKDKKLIVDEYDNVKIIPTKPVSEDLTSLKH